MATKDALSVLNQLEIQGAPIDTHTLLNLALKTSTARSGPHMGPLLLVVGCWLFSILDAYRIGKPRDLLDG